MTTPAETPAFNAANEIMGKLGYKHPVWLDELVPIIQAAIDESLPKWEPIASAPKDGTPVLLFVPSYCDEIIIGSGDEDGCWEVGGVEFEMESLEFEIDGREPGCYPTHWLSLKALPQPPEDARC